ncbi:NAD(P)H-dependent oxidoreductase [Mesorhizobium sp. B2-5-9]|uniref:NAD(P)H-dependent oxidoreductase n=1 Tax=Mesorhizobium sp. B2-5-9 TaxID=2589921 RepID=UPI0011260104|nr:NAD(P)H-dependent oxidoreductase [Mesorhizobium sp. B2-5-9]TPK16741.1 NAD(P)H-dependent oxidoreductase [Mesorhizobium sp. B2-5-9]
MLRDRPMFIGVTSGGVFSGDRANQPDFLTPYLTLAFGSIGLKTLQFLPLQATAFLDRDKAEVAREKALAAIDVLAVRELRGLDTRPAVLASTVRSCRDVRLLWGASYQLSEARCKLRTPAS